MKENFQTLSLKNICKNFPGVCANSDITIDFKASEVHALLGENGAGKTTLMNIIYGIYNQDKGDILINNKKINIRSPKDAISSGIGMVHQHFMLVQNHTVCENILLGYK
ncbi:MAG TPA: ATP-binding cassette domain-containing protein, partial [Exilispira sp.]|nr:ATP-binding cassette domain-containing protein [Exilispira sp.]